MSYSLVPSSGISVGFGSHERNRLLQFRLLENLESSAIFSRRYTLEKSPMLFAREVAGIIEKASSHTRITGIASKNVCVVSDKVITEIGWTSTNEDVYPGGREVQDSPDKNKRLTFTLTIASDLEISDKILDALDLAYGTIHLPSVMWKYKQDGRVFQADIILDEEGDFHDSFYPYIEEGVNQYIDRYVSSKCCLLFLHGAPGTGKTTFVRHIIHHTRFPAVVTYDDDILSSDSMFVDFLTSSDADLLIIEDADTMLASREEAGNKLISRFLNVSEGLIKFDRKKIIFTTNIKDFSKVDEALLRPGRCFDVVNFRPLTFAEALTACESAKLEKPSRIEGKSSYTVAELYNKDAKIITKPKVGFAT